MIGEDTEKIAASMGCCHHANNLAWRDHDEGFALQTWEDVNGDRPDDWSAFWSSEMEKREQEIASVGTELQNLPYFAMLGPHHPFSVDQQHCAFVHTA
jgi:hypothetical protein